MMQCEVIRDLLPLYIDDCCSEPSRKLVEEHLKECEKCRKFAENMKCGLLIEEEETNLYLSEERLLKDSKKSIKKEVKKDFFAKAVILDLLLNFVLAFYFGNTILKNMQAGLYIAPMSQEFMHSFEIYRWLGIMWVLFCAVFDIIFLRNRKKGVSGMISWGVSGLSVFFKVIVFFVGGFLWIITLL